MPELLAHCWLESALESAQDGRGSLETSREGAVVGAAAVVVPLDDAETVPEVAALVLVLGAEVMVPEELEPEETESVEVAEDDWTEEPEADWVEEMSDDCVDESEPEADWEEALGTSEDEAAAEELRPDCDEVDAEETAEPD